MKYKLTGETKLKDAGKHLFFEENNECRCYSLPFMLLKMKDEGIQSMIVCLAKRTPDPDYFYCNHFEELGEKGYCGRSCEAYKPRNGKSGVCKSFRDIYENTGIKFTLTITEQ